MTELEKRLEWLNEIVAGMAGDRIIPREKLIKALVKAIEQRNVAYVCSRDKFLSDMTEEDDQELMEILK